MKNKNNLVLLMSAGLMMSLAAGCAGPFFSPVQGSGQPASEERSLSGVRDVILEGAGEIILTQGSQESVKITCDDNLLVYVDTDQSGGTLSLGFRKGMSFQSSLGIRMEVTVRDLSSVKLRGAGNIRGSSLDLSSLEVNLEGTGNIVLEGQAGSLKAGISGTGSLEARDFSAASVSVDLSGVGNAEVRALEVLDARISGMGSILYWGKPARVSTTVAGLGSVVEK